MTPVTAGAVAPRCSGAVYLTFLRDVRGSFSASSLVIWAAQVAGGDEPPSVLSDNLPKVWLIQLDLSFCSCSRIARMESAYFVVARRGKAPPLPPPQHGGRAISDARS